MAYGDFIGAKAALFIGAELLVIRRDDHPGLPFAGMLDFPGGGREGAESPEETLRREVHEEVGLALPREALLWRRDFPAMVDPARLSWFFVARLPAGAERGIVFGDEGQGWALMPPGAYLAARDAIPSLQSRLRVWLSETA